ncbi:MAG: tRNA (adenosine(37)-N6)-threonylcarbamoyltransferase complex ATPase subunit type 1 TsaE [Dehalococcoidia bacterium]|nr:tRNA (adenosine(37)-N6)-threonylcarbamoyltransferase complex ATPase subunit type 1 TsaE [Dehalococcoidia bacterium]MDD5493469.1 tRNA (adenosine(37)-N6)-threonylcarbamoyltransferase complex ATPase subunit type 1 TsaE [Dehalococcoidia bacterium]
MNRLNIITIGSEQTQNLGSHIGKLSQGNDVYLLTGILGAGKTCLVQGIAFGLGIKEYTCSPSFMIAREYRGRLHLNHLDLYRLDNIEEIADLGIEEYFNAESVCAIEWAEKGGGILPVDNLNIHLEYISENERKIMLEPHGRRYNDLLKQLAHNLQGDDKGKWNFL